MLYLLLWYVFISCVCIWAGIIIYSFIPKGELENKSLMHFLITGLIGLTAIGQWIVLFSPLNLFILFLILLSSCLAILFRRKAVLDSFRKCKTSFNGKNVLLFITVFCFLLMVLTLNAGPTVMDDTDSYHIQMVKWIQEFGSVPGIANLHLRFGFNTSWFTSIGLLSLPQHGRNSYLVLNGVLAFWFCYYILESLFNFVRRGLLNNSYHEALGCFILLILCLLNWPMIRGCATSANYDFITTACVVVLFIDFFGNSSKPGLEWLLWPVYLATVRMINFPLLLLSIAYCLDGLRPFAARKLVCFVSVAIILVLPFLARNVILSGYPFFPYYRLDLFSFDWKADKSRLEEIMTYVKYFNRVNPMFRPIAETSQLGFPQWTISWFTNLFPFDKLIAVLSFLGYLIFLFRPKKTLTHLQKCFIGVMIIQLICWFFIAPDPRFVQGSLLFGIFLVFQKTGSFQISMQKFWKFSLILVAGLVLTYSLSKIIRDENYRNFLSPHPLPVPAVWTLTLDHIELHLPSRVLNNWNPRCFDVALPCLYKLDPRVEARGKGISDGFRLRPVSGNIPQGGEYKIKE